MKQVLLCDFGAWNEPWAGHHYRNRRRRENVMDDLLGAMLSGGKEDEGDDKPGSDPMGDLLGSLMGGSGGEAGGTADLLGSLLGGASGETGDAADLLGGLLGGAGGEAGGASALLGGLLGGSQQGGGDLGGLLGTMLGSGGAGGPLAPMIDGIAKKLGLPAETVQQVVNFVLGKLLSGRMRTDSGQASRQAGQEELELEQMLAQVSRGGEVDAGYLASTGLTEELAQQTGLDQEMAERSLQEVLGALGGQMGEAQDSSGPDLDDFSIPTDLFGSR
jgi:hypothetical protein